MAVLLGHTLGTPALTVLQALDLFARSGLDGAEVIWQDGYKSAIPETDGEAVASEVKQHATLLGLAIGCLTPYVTEINSLDDELRAREVERLTCAIQTAANLDCPRIRIYGGKLLGGESEDAVADMWGRLVESLQVLGAQAEREGIVLCVENHFSTMTVSAADTASLIRDVQSPAVRVLYDQANLAFTHRENFEDAIRLQAPWISHVHVKDLEFIDAGKQLVTSQVASIDKANRIHMSRVIGDGILDWKAIVARLREIPYDGSYSLEYEYRWNPEDLPPPETGIPESARRLRQLVNAVE
jgi:sugar phosphate isomerase/epimerase